MKLDGTKGAPLRFSRHEPHEVLDFFPQHSLKIFIDRFDAKKRFYDDFGFENAARLKGSIIQNK